MRTPEPELDEVLATFERLFWEAQLSERDLDKLDQGNAQERARLALYRDFVRHRLHELVATALPRTTRALGRAEMDTWVDAQLTKCPPTTRFFREVPGQLIDASDPRLLGTELPHLPDLVRLELAQWKANWLDLPVPAPIPLDLAAPLQLHPTMVRLDLHHSVHLAEEEPREGAFFVAVYRRNDDVVETRWMDRTLASVLDGWMRGLPALEAVREACALHGETLDGAVVERMSELLSLLVERGGVLAIAESDASGE